MFDSEDSPADILRYKINKLDVIRTTMENVLEEANSTLELIGIPLEFDTLIAHPTYEIQLINNLITKLSAELAIESRKEKLAQSV